MGLLDNLYIGQNANFGGQQGGLLDFLRQTQMQNQQYQPSAGFAQPNAIDAAQWPVGPVGAPTGEAQPVAIGGYQMPRVGGMAAFTPVPDDPAALPPNAQPTQGQMAQTQPAQPAEQPSLFGPGSFFGRIGNPDGLIAKLTGNDTRSVALEQANQTAKFLVSKGMDPAMAKAVVSDPVLTRAVLPQIMGLGGGQTDDIKEYQFAKKEDPTLTFQKFMSQKKAVSGEFGMQPIWGTGPDGKPAVLQLGKSGEAKQSLLPPGFNLARDPIKVEGPTGTTILDPQTRQQVGFIPKDNAKKEEDEKVGQARGTAKATLANGADLDAASTIKKIDEFANSKGFNEVFGQLDQYRPSWTHSNEGTDALARYKQLKGTAFLSAYSMLKGGGAITDIEGQKAGDAMARLDRAQGEAEARAALKDFREAVDMGLRKLKRAANGGTEPTEAPSSLPAKTDLKAKYGLD